MIRLIYTYAYILLSYFDFVKFFFKMIFLDSLDQPNKSAAIPLHAQTLQPIFYIADAIRSLL